jgi:hypothetical protein
VVVHVRLALVLLLEVLVGVVGVAKRCVIVLVAMAGAEMVEPACHPVVIVGHVVVLVGVDEIRVIVLLPCMTGSVSHVASCAIGFEANLYPHPGVLVRAGRTLRMLTPQALGFDGVAGVVG